MINQPEAGYSLRMGKTHDASEYARPDFQVQIAEVGGTPEGVPEEAPGIPRARRARTMPNPYFLAGWALAVGMTTVGILMILGIRSLLLSPPLYADHVDPFSSGTMLGDPSTGFMRGMAGPVFLPTPEVSALAPALVIAGLVAAMLLLVVHGVMHRLASSAQHPNGASRSEEKP
jgi:hypothetical protein